MATSKDSGERREEFERDRDRILYAPEFRRLNGVSQVASVDEVRLLHNRSAHSVKAAQLGRRIAERLVRQNPNAESFLHPDVVETACLAHDLGHPPFGHIGEWELHRLLRPIGGFEGNAQTLRIVSKLSVRKGGQGLDLTRATLNGVIKYPLVGIGQAAPPHPWTDRRYGDKAGVYETEARALEWCRAGVQGEARSAEAALMDWADDVTYAVHDLEDFFQAGLVPLHYFEQVSGRVYGSLLKRAANWTGFSQTKARRALERLVARLNVGGPRPYDDSIEDRQALRRTVSTLLTRYVEAVTVSAGSIRVDEKAQYEVALLKEMTRHFVIDSPPLRLKQRGQIHALRNVFFGLWDLMLQDEADPPVSPSLQTMVALFEEDDESAEALEKIFEHADSEGKIKPSKEWPSLFSGDIDETTGNFYRDLTTPRRAAMARALSDYLCSLTENQVIDLYARLTHARQASMFESWS